MLEGKRGGRGVTVVASIRTSFLVLYLLQLWDQIQHLKRTSKHTKKDIGNYFCLNSVQQAGAVLCTPEVGLLL